MDLDLVKQFLLNYLPEDAHINVHQVMMQIKEHPLQILSTGSLYNELKYLKSGDRNLAISNCSGILTGFALAYSTRSTEFCNVIKQYIDTAAKARGENVVSFLGEKKKT